MILARTLRTAALATAFLALAAPVVAEDNIHQNVVVIETTTVKTVISDSDQDFTTIEPAAGPLTTVPHNALTPQQQRNYDSIRYDDGNYKG